MATTTAADDKAAVKQAEIDRLTAKIAACKEWLEDVEQQTVTVREELEAMRAELRQRLRDYHTLGVLVLIRNNQQPSQKCEPGEAHSPYCGRRIEEDGQ